MSTTKPTTQAEVNIEERSMRSTELKDVRMKMQHAGKRLTWRADRYDVTSESVKQRQKVDEKSPSPNKGVCMKAQHAGNFLA